MCAPPLNGVDCLGEFLETRPVLSTLGILDVAINCIANFTCSVNKHVGHLRIPSERHNIIAHYIDQILDNLSGGIDLVGEPC